MTTRSLLFIPFIASLFLPVAYAESSLNAAVADQSKAVIAKSENHEKPANQAAQALTKTESAPSVNDIVTTTPFLLKGGMDDFSAKPAEAIRTFEGLGAFQRFLSAEKQVVWPICDFASVKLPKDDQGFRRVLSNHAAQIGADYVVIFTNTMEIKRQFPSVMNQLVFCARAYRRVTARLGIEGDPTAAKEDVVKISGFTPGSQAEQSGLRVGDVVKKVDGEKPGNSVYNDHEYWSKALHWKAGDKIEVEVERDGKPLELAVVLTAG